jgi:carbonic anhydrase
MTDIENKCVTGKKQSPLEIISSNATECSSLCSLLFFYRSSLCTIENTGKEFYLYYDSGSSVIYKDVVYQLETMSYTRPSSHKIDGKQFDAELMLHHYNKISNTILIVSVFLQLNDSNILSRTQTFLNEFISLIPQQSGSYKTLSLGNEWNIFDVLPETKSFYTYDGSTIRGNCTENVTWIVMSNPVYTNITFFDKIKTLFPNTNNRDTIKDDSRTINYNPNLEKANNQNYGSAMRCYDDKSFRNQCAILSNNAMIEKQNNDSTKAIILAILIFIIIIIAVIMYKNGYFNSIINGLKGGIEVIKNKSVSGYNKITTFVNRKTNDEI